MATKDKKKSKKVKVIIRRKKAAVSKGGGLPKSVKALLGYLGKSDTALSGSAAPQRAQLAPQVTQQQQQQQQQQQPQFVFRARAAHGSVIGKSPLTAIQAAAPPAPPAQNIVIKTTATPQQRDDTKKDDSKIPDALSKLNERVLGIEDMGKKAVTGIQSSLKRIDQRVKFFEEGWEDVQTMQTPAVKSGTRPNLKETRFGSAISLGDIRPSFQSISPARRLSFGGGQAAALTEDDEADDAQSFFAQSHIQNVTNPEIQPVVKVRGRRPGTKLTPTTLESFRTKRAATAAAKKAQSQQLYQELEHTQSTHLLETAARNIMIKPKQRLLTPRKRADIDAAMTASAQIEQLVAGGGAAAAIAGHTPVPPAVLRDNGNVSVRKSNRKVSKVKGGGNEGDV